MAPNQRSRQSGPHRSFPSSSRWRETRSAAGSSVPWHGQAAMSPACRTWQPISPPNASKSCARFSRVCVDWPSWPIPIFPAPCPNGTRSTLQRTLGLEIVPLPIRRAEDIASALEGLKGRVDALYVVGDPLANLNRVRINTFALVARLPTIYVQREYVEAGGLMSYGPNFPDLNRRAADYVDKVLRGAKPADLPVEQPTKFDLTVNLITARALGITVPPTLLTRADEVIE